MGIAWEMSDSGSIDGLAVVMDPGKRFALRYATSTPTNSVPGPAALPLLGVGSGGIRLLAIRRKRDMPGNDPP